MAKLLQRVKEGIGMAHATEDPAEVKAAKEVRWRNLLYYINDTLASITFQL
jgi:hypothetical protein